MNMGKREERMGKRKKGEKIKKRRMEEKGRGGRERRGRRESQGVLCCHSLLVKTEINLLKTYGKGRGKK